MKKKIIVKKVVCALLSVSLLLMTGCSSDVEENTGNTTGTVESTDESKEDETLKSTENESKTDVAETTTSIDEAESENNEDENDSKKDFMTTKGFIPLSQAIEFYEFEKEENEDSMFIYADSTYTGQYRLCSDNMDQIKVDFDYDMSEGYIEVNGVKSTFYASAISNVSIVDVDKNDSYKEIVLYDEGPSADPTILLYRYCNDELHKLGDFYGKYDFDNVLFDQHGKIISAEGYIDFLDTRIVGSYYVIEGNKANNILTDISSALNQKYRVSRDMTVAFNTSKDNMYDIENLINIKAGDAIILIEAYENLTVFYVELQDGTKGYICTQIAG